MLICMSGCVSVKKQQDRAHRYFDENPAEFARKAADKFPPRVEYIKGDKEILIERETVIEKGEPVPCPEAINPITGKLETNFVQCPEVKIITEKYLRVDSLLKASTAREEQYRLEFEAATIANIKQVANLEAKLTSSEENEKEARKTAKNRLLIIMGLGAAGIVAIVLRIKRII